METQTTSLPTNWLEATDIQYDYATASGGDVSYWYGEPINHYYYHWYPTWTYSRKIRLSMSDVEKLRSAAKEDPALKEVLKKIGPHIEVEVDF